VRNPPASAPPWSPEEEDTVSVVRKPDTCQTFAFESSEEKIVTRAVSQLVAKRYLLGPPRVGLRWKNVAPKCSYLPLAERHLQVFLCWGFQGSPLDCGIAGSDHQPSLMCDLQLWRRKRENRSKATP